MRIFITGAGGFAGTHLINILKDDHQIIGLTHPFKDSDDPKVKFINADILDKPALADIISREKPDCIFHLAAKAITNQSDPEDAFKVNLFGTLNLYEAVLKFKIEKYNPKIVFVGSAEVYGKTNNPENISEVDLTNPVSFYGVSKIAADRLSYQYSKSQKLNIVIIRPFNHTGPGQNKGFFVPDMASQIVELENNPEKNELLVGNLESIRDLSDVRDIVRAYKLILEKDTFPGEVFNICSGKGIKMQSILDKLLKLAKKEIKIVQDPARMRPSDTPFTIGSNQKFSSQFNWQPEIPLEKTLEDTLNFWRNIRD